MIHSINETSVREYISLVKEMNMGETKRAHVITFGCQQNERDSETVLGLLGEMGYIPTDNADDADIIVINTCAIREHAEMKALSLLGSFKANKRRNPDFILGICGCMANESHIADKLKKDFHYVSFTLEPGRYELIPELVYRSYVIFRGF